MGRGRRALVCDFDGTLITTDSLQEAVVRCVLFNPIHFIRSVLILLRKGRLDFKMSLHGYYAQSYTACVDSTVLDFLIRNKDEFDLYIYSGCPNEKLVMYVSEIFSDTQVVVKGSGDVNFIGEAKAEMMLAIGAESISYVGNTTADLPCWNLADKKYFAGNKKEWSNVVRRSDIVIEQLSVKVSPSVRDYISQLRVYQWVKNTLVFVPAVLSMEFDWVTCYSLLLAFLSLSLVASGTYILNDIHDLEKDRKHPRKKKRPLASGVFKPIHGLLLSIALVIAGVLGAFTINMGTGLSVLCYLTLTLLYTYSFKNRAVVNVLSLSALFCIRVITGGVASSCEITAYFLSFCLLVFASLAFMKRTSELIQKLPGQNYKGYGYQDITVLMTLGVSLSVASGVVLLNYVIDTFQQDLAINIGLCIIPSFLFWIGHNWLTTSRGEMSDDPIVHSLCNWRSQLAIASMVLFFLCAHTVESSGLKIF